MPIVGIDLGYTYTKTSDLLMFPSKYTEVEPILGGKKIIINGKTYYVGEGKGTVDVNKINDDVTKVCLVYALSKTNNISQLNIVTGLPISQYKNQKDQLKKMILDNRYNYIVLDEKEKKISIDSIEVYPQGAGALYSQQILSDAIIVDIGGRTVDIAYFDILGNKRKLVNSITLYDGMLVLYSNIIALVNSKYDLTLSAQYAERILLQGLTVDGEKQDISFLRPVIAEHIERICEEIRLNYPYLTTDIYLCGGGASILYKAFNNRFKNVSVMQNSQFANAIGFKKVGESLWMINR